MASVASQLIEKVTAHAQSDSLEDAREICADGTYFPNNLCMYVLCTTLLANTALDSLYCRHINFFLIIIFVIYIHYNAGPVAQSVVRLSYGLDGLVIESRWGRDIPPVQTGPVAHPASGKMGTGSFPGVKCGRSVVLTTHFLLVPRSWKSRAIPLPTLWATPCL